MNILYYTKPLKKWLGRRSWVREWVVSKYVLFRSQGIVYSDYNEHVCARVIL